MIETPVTTPEKSVKPSSSAKLEILYEEVPCNLCGSNDVTVKYEGTTDLDTARMIRSYSASGNFISKETLVTCDHCGLIFTSPRLSRSFILKGYTENEDPGYVSQAEGRIRSFKACLRRLERFEKAGKVLDVGAAAGFFLKVAKDAGWTPYGIEPSQYLSEFGNKNYGVNIHRGTIEDMPDWGTKMDAVTLWDVLEHTFDPKDVLKRCHYYLKEGGHIVVNYPNIGNWMARLAGRNYWFIISVHLYYFTPKTIKKMLEETGFEVVESGPHFQTLELGYLVYRLEAYLPRLAKLMKKVISALKCESMLIPYFAAQTRVIGRKVRGSC